jgi:hypothetical protein
LPVALREKAEAGRVEQLPQIMFLMQTDKRVSKTAGEDIVNRILG